MTPFVFDANVRDFNLKPLGYLTDCIECTVEEQINDIYELSLKYPVNGLNYDLLQNERLILVKVKDGNSTNYNDPIYQPFSIYKISRPIDQMVTINAQHVSYLATYVLYNALQNDESRADQKGINNLIEMLNDPNNLIPGITNPFTISQEDIRDTTCQYLTAVPKTLRSMIGGDADSIIESLKYEVEFDKYNITFKKKRGQDRGVKIAYSKNLTNFDQTEEMGSVITAILPYYSSGESSAIGQITYAYASDGYKKNRNGVPVFESGKYFEKKTVYEPLSVEPDYWNSRWHTYYELADPTIPGVYTNVRPVPILFESGKYYELDAETGIYSVLIEEPSDWNTNYSEYYEKYHMDSVMKKYRKLSNMPPVFNADVFYKKTSDEDDTNEVFELVETEPPDWDTTWPNYYYYWYDETSKYSLKYHSNHVATRDVSSSFSEAPTNPEFMSFYAREYMKKEKTYKPKISMTVSFISLWQTPEYSNIAPLEYVSIGDTVHVYFPAYNIFTEARVNKIIYDVITEQYESLDLGEPSEGFAESSVETKIDTKDIIRNTARDLSTAYDKGIRKAIADFGASTGSYVSMNQDSTGKITSITVSDTETITDKTKRVVAITANGIGFWTMGDDGASYDPAKLTGLINADGLTIPATTTGTLNADLCNVTNIKAENIIVRDPNKPQDIGVKYSEYINVEPGKITIGSPEAQVKMVSLADRLVFVDTQVLENIPMALRGYNAYDIPKFISNYYLGNISDDDDTPVWKLLTSKPDDWDIPPEGTNSPWRSKTHDSEKYKRRKVYAYISDNVFYTNEIRIQNIERVGRFQKYIRSDNSLVMIRGG